VFLAFDGDVFLKQLGRKSLPGLCAVRLAAFWAVDAFESDLMLIVLAIDHRQCVAVGDCDHFADEDSNAASF